jgi:hypothetical protein
MRTYAGEGVQFRRFRDLFICLNVSMGIITILFANVDAAKWLELGYVQLLGVEVRIKSLLGMRQTDLIEGHFAFWIPTMALSLALWLILRAATRNNKAARAAIPIVVGVAIFLMPTLIWLFGRPRDTMPPLNWPFWELLGAALMAIWVRLRLPGRILLLALGPIVIWCRLHNTAELAGYFGPAGPILGFLASAGWTWDLALRWVPKATKAAP